MTRSNLTSISQKLSHQERANGDSFFTTDVLYEALKIVKNNIDKKDGNDEKSFCDLLSLEKALNNELKYVRSIR